MEGVAVVSQPASIPGNEGGPLVAVTFQKNPHQIEKYLEAEPKALGLTQITLSVFQISMVLGALFSLGGDSNTVEITVQLIGSLFVIIAGSIAVAAQNLHLPTLKACLGMQVVACLCSVINFVMTSSQFGFANCWGSLYDNDTENVKICRNLGSGFDHYNAELLLINIAVLAICATLTAYCCKVINCCTPRASMPVITISAPPAQQ